MYTACGCLCGLRPTKHSPDALNNKKLTRTNKDGTNNCHLFITLCMGQFNTNIPTSHR